MNKKVYEQPEVMVVTFSVTDVMLTSGSPAYASDIYTGGSEGGQE